MTQQLNKIKKKKKTRKDQSKSSSYQYHLHHIRPLNPCRSRARAFVSLTIVYLEICYPNCNHVKHNSFCIQVLEHCSHISDSQKVGNISGYTGSIELK